MKEKIDGIKQSGLEALKSSNTLEDIENIRVKYLGKKGELTLVLRSMKDVSPEERPLIGAMVNEAKEELESKIELLKLEISKKERNSKMLSERIDVTMPGTPVSLGKKHVLNGVVDQIEDIFLGMGYEIAEGYDVELDYYNFEALNIPKNHPARDTQDTFYINDNVVLRTHTSPMQARFMENHKPPIKIIVPGMVYRSDEVDATHSPVFHQMEGLVVGKGITMAHLKGTLDEFARQFFGEKTRTKFRPHHFNFTEPSAEVDVSCFNCGGNGCRICKGEGWIEILGCGMVHPRVLEMAGIDPNEYSGFAFGLGIERLAMLKYEIEDMRLLYENDVRFLNQF